MTNTYIFIRHAETKKDPENISIDWNLTEKGFDQVAALCDLAEFQDADILLSSEEEKAYQTIKPLAEKLGKEITRLSYFNEQTRGDKFLSADEFGEYKRKTFADSGYVAEGGESAEQALERFKEGLSRLDSKYSNKKIVLASHGTILSLFFNKLTGKQREGYSRWQKLGFCDWGIMEDDKVIKDIV